MTNPKWNNILVDHLCKVAFESQFEESWLSVHPKSIEKALWEQTITNILAALERRGMFKKGR